MLCRDSAVTHQQPQQSHAGTSHTNTNKFLLTSTRSVLTLTSSLATNMLVLGLIINRVKILIDLVDFRMGGLKVVKNGPLSLYVAPEMEEVLRQV